MRRTQFSAAGSRRTLLRGSSGGVRRVRHGLIATAAIGIGCAHLDQQQQSKRGVPGRCVDTCDRDFLCRRVNIKPHHQLTDQEKFAQLICG